MQKNNKKDEQNCEGNFAFTLDDLKQAFEDGGSVLSFSDMGVKMKYDSFDEWFNEFYTNNQTTVGTRLFEFTMTNKNGLTTKATIPCSDWLHANRIKQELLSKSFKLTKVEFEELT